MMQLKPFAAIAAIATISVLASCEQSADEQASKAVIAQRDANERIARANAEGQKQVNQAQKEADENIAQANAEVQREASEAQQAANLDIREANEESFKLRNTYQIAASKSVSEIDNRIDALKVQAQSSKPGAQAQFEGAMPRVEAHRATVKEDLGAIEGQSAATFASYKAKTDKDIDELRRAVDDAATRL